MPILDRYQTGNNQPPLRPEQSVVRVFPVERHIGGKTLDRKEVAIATFIRAGVAALVVVIVLLVLYAAQFFLVVFGGILLAILFHAMSSWLHRKTGMPEKWSRAVSLIAPFLLLGVFIWFIAPSVSEQASELADRVPKSFRQLQQKALQYQWLNSILSYQEQLREALPSGSKAMSLVGTIFSSTLSALGNLVLALAIGIFLAVNPHLYTKGLIALIPPRRRARAIEVLDATRSTLASWLIAKIVEMTVIGVLTTIGLWIIGIDLALVLGIIAGLLSFIPNFGPIISIIPALLIALVGGVNQVLYVIGLYAAVQTLESYILTPMLQQHLVDMPPALTVSVQVLFGLLAGVLGVIMATPLTAAAMVMTKMWYVEDILGDRGRENK